ncbi:PAS domain [Trinorchestia longiramus]|nr:PAS domain [Trinorchestia longiramus]
MGRKGPKKYDTGGSHGEEVLELSSTPWQELSKSQKNYHKNRMGSLSASVQTPSARFFGRPIVTKRRHGGGVIEPGGNDGFTNLICIRKQGFGIQANMHDILKMCSFEGTKSTKGASKMRRDLLNAEIGQLRELLPLPPSTRQRLSQLQLMALVCVYVRKSNYFQQVLKQQATRLATESANMEFLKALNGFLIMMTQGGKLLYISDNAAEYLGHSMEDLLIHGDSVFDILDKQDHAAVQAELVRAAQGGPEDDRLFLCRMNVSRNARRQMRFGDQKVVLVHGHFLSYLPLCSRNEPVFLAHCSPVAMPETRESVVQGATNVFTTLHTLDMKILSIDKNGEFYLGYNKSSLAGVSWYHLIHPDNLRDAQTKHRLITSSEQERSCILLLRLQAAGGSWRWVHCVLQLKDAQETNTNTTASASTSATSTTAVAAATIAPTPQPPIPPSSTAVPAPNVEASPSTSNAQAAQPSQSQATPTLQNQQQPIIVATNQVLSEREAAVLRSNSWLYHYYTMQSKLQYGLAYEAQRVHAYYPQVMPYQHDSRSASSCHAQHDSRSASSCHAQHDSRSASSCHALHDSRSASSCHAQHDSRSASSCHAQHDSRSASSCHAQHDSRLVIHTLTTCTLLCPNLLPTIPFCRSSSLPFPPANVLHTPSSPPPLLHQRPVQTAISEEFLLSSYSTTVLSYFRYHKSASRSGQVWVDRPKRFGGLWWSVRWPPRVSRRHDRGIQKGASNEDRIVVNITCLMPTEIVRQDLQIPRRPSIDFAY